MTKLVAVAVVATSKALPVPIKSLEGVKALVNLVKLRGLREAVELATDLRALERPRGAL